VCRNSFPCAATALPVMEGHLQRPGDVHEFKLKGHCRAPVLRKEPCRKVQQPTTCCTVQFVFQSCLAALCSRLCRHVMLCCVHDSSITSFSTSPPCHPARP
jgi:hypothetical protein